MSALSYILPLCCGLVAALLSFRLARRGRFRPVGWLILVAGLAFWLCIHLADSAIGWDGIGFAIVAMLIIIPVAAGLLFGLLIGAALRWHAGPTHG